MSLNKKLGASNCNDHDPPLWRQHFPLDTDGETSRSRREFLGGLTVAGGSMACGQVALSQLAPAADPSGDSTVAMESVVLERKLQDIDTDEAVLFHYPDEKSPCLLVKISDDEFVAFLQKCTHLACPVIPNAKRNEFHCPCHHGKFDLRTGQPIAGPPQSALATVNVMVADDGTLTATGIRKSGA